MLKLVIPAVELFDEKTEEFISSEETVLKLEHSLVSLSKWEAEFEKPFLGPGEKSIEETIGYVRAMSLKPVDMTVFLRISQTQFEEISNYINAKMSATWFAQDLQRPGSREIITSEIIYYWMTALNVPFEAEEWHLNRLFTLIKVANEKNAAHDKKKKMSPGELAARNRQLNEQRRQQMGTSG